MVKFQAPYDRTAAIISLLVCVFLLLVPVFLQNIYPSILPCLSWSPRTRTRAQALIALSHYSSATRVNILIPAPIKPQPRGRAEPADYQGTIRL